MKEKGFPLKTLLMVGFISLITGLFIASSLPVHSNLQAADNKGKAIIPEERPQSFSQLVKALKPAVVNISTTQVIKH